MIHIATTPEDKQKLSALVAIKEKKSDGALGGLGGMLSGLMGGEGMGEGLGEIMTGRNFLNFSIFFFPVAR